MIPPIAAASSTDSNRLDIQSPTREQEVTLQLICERYQGTNGVPLMTFERDGTKSLIYPPNIRGRIPQLGGKVADSLTTETPSPVRLPDGTGAGNGLPAERGN